MLSLRLCYTRNLSAVGALGLDVARLLALVADLLATSRLLGALAGEMAGNATVIALVAVDAVTGQMTHAAARVAGLLVEVATIAGVVATTIGVAALLAVAGNMADLAALVALSRAATTTTLAWTLVTTGGAVARDMAGLAAAVAGLGVLGTLGAVTAHVALNATVIALGGTLVGAVAGLMSGLPAYISLMLDLLSLTQQKSGGVMVM